MGEVWEICIFSRQGFVLSDWIGLIIRVNFVLALFFLSFAVVF